MPEFLARAFGRDRRGGRGGRKGERGEGRGGREMQSWRRRRREEEALIRTKSLLHFAFHEEPKVFKGLSAGDAEPSHEGAGAGGWWRALEGCSGLRDAAGGWPGAWVECWVLGCIRCC